MLQVAKMPLARRLWRIARTLHIPVTEVSRLTLEELDFCEYSMLVDDPKKLEQYENTYHDPDYDEFERQFDEEMKQEYKTGNPETLMQKNGADELMQEFTAEELASMGYAMPVAPIPGEEWESVD